MRSPAKRTLSVFLPLVLGVASCFTGSDGLTPPTDSLYFPTGLVVSPGGHTLYVANSDFDLQFNGGTVMALGLSDGSSGEGPRSKFERLAGQIQAGASAATACDAIGSKPNQEPTLVQGPCEPVAIAPYIKNYAIVGAFASSVSLQNRGDGPGSRLFVTVRGDPSVTYFDIDDDRDPNAVVTPCTAGSCLSCAADPDERRCGGRHLVGRSPVSSVRGLSLPTEPVGIAGVELPAGGALVVAHQTEGSASLIQNHWEGVGLGAPTLEFTLRDLDEGPTGVAVIPAPALVRELSASIKYRPAFVVSHRAASTLSVVRYESDVASRPARPFLVLAERTPVSVSGDGIDSRGMTIDDSERRACEANANDIAQLTVCAEVPLRFYLASRSPASLMVGTIDTEVTIGTNGQASSVTERVSLDEVVPLTIGPSGVALGQVIGLTGAPELRVFVASFDTRFLAVYDPALRSIETLIRTGRGPAGMAFDRGTLPDGTMYSHLYLGQFTDSYLSVIDLDMRRPSYANVVLTLGPRVAPREEQ